MIKLDYDFCSTKGIMKMKNPFDGYTLEDEETEVDVSKLLRMTKKEAEFHAWKLMTQALKENNDEQITKMNWIIKLINE